MSVILGARSSFERVRPRRVYHIMRTPHGIQNNPPRVYNTFAAIRTHMDSVPNPYDPRTVVVVVGYCYYASVHLWFRFEHCTSTIYSVISALYVHNTSRRGLVSRRHSDTVANMVINLGLGSYRS